MLDGKGDRNPLASNRQIDANIAYAIFTASAKMGCPRQMEEVARYCNVSVRRVWDVQKLQAPQSMSPEIKAADYATRYCSLLELDYSHSLIIAKIVDSGQFRQKVGAIKSNSLIAVAIYLYCKEKKIKIPLKRILQACDGISATTIFRAIRKIDKEHVFKITSLIS